MLLDVELTVVLVVGDTVEDDGGAEVLVLVVALTELDGDERVAELVEIEVVEGKVDNELDELDVGVDGGAAIR